MQRMAKPAAKTRPRGRPFKGDAGLMKPISIRFPPPMMKEIEAIQSARMDAPELSAIVRELVAEALTARAARKSVR
jgi:hypothetical protein